MAMSAIRSLALNTIGASVNVKWKGGAICGASSRVFHRRGSSRAHAASTSLNPIVATLSSSRGARKNRLITTSSTKAPSVRLAAKPAAKKTTRTFAALGDGLTFMSAPVAEATEITGPIAARLVVSSSTADADLFLVLRLFDPAGKEVAFQGALDPHTPVAQGWLRASHRRLDRRLTRPWRPYHTHDKAEKLKPGRKVTLDIELWPTSIVVPKGWRVGLSVRGRDYEHDGPAAALSNMKHPMRGCGPFLHNDPRDRPAPLFSGDTTLYFGRGAAAYVLLPIIPAKPAQRRKSR